MTRYDTAPKHTTVILESSRVTVAHPYFTIQTCVVSEGMDTLIEIRRLMKEGKQASGHAQVLYWRGNHFHKIFASVVLDYGI